MMERSRASPDKDKICVWTLPEGSPPAVRVEVEGSCVVASFLFRTVCDALGLYEKSRPFFTLLKGLGKPTKKYGDKEVISLPCKFIISLQRWSFDCNVEKRFLRTDETAFRLLAEHTMSELKEERMDISKDDLVVMKGHMDARFPCYKQYVDYARSLAAYSTLTISKAEVTKEVKLKTRTLKAGTKIDIKCTTKTITLASSTVQLSIPWRKIRRWTQVVNFVDISYEVYLADENAFVWVHIKTSQAFLLLQATIEFIDCMKTTDKATLMDDSTRSRGKTKLTWKLFKEEILGIRDTDDSDDSNDSNDDEEDRKGDDGVQQKTVELNINFDDFEHDVLSSSDDDGDPTDSTDPTDHAVEKAPTRSLLSLRTNRTRTYASKSQ